MRIEIQKLLIIMVTSYSPVKRIRKKLLSSSSIRYVSIWLDLMRLEIELNLQVGNNDHNTFFTINIERRLDKITKKKQKKLQPRN